MDFFSAESVDWFGLEGTTLKIVLKDHTEKLCGLRSSVGTVTPWFRLPGSLRISPGRCILFVRKIQNESLPRRGGALQAAEKLESPVILRSSGDEESRIALKMLRPRSFA